ncbi:hypothetical protein GCM10010289_68910 [Streptomyces violascens]|nr:hypothetical protein GCM10010289_68910 [Streptomyces violascens]
MLRAPAGLTEDGGHHLGVRRFSQDSHPRLPSPHNTLLSSHKPVATVTVTPRPDLERGEQPYTELSLSIYFPCWIDFWEMCTFTPRDQGEMYRGEAKEACGPFLRSVYYALVTRTTAEKRYAARGAP